jgi:hypothetical protein
MVEKERILDENFDRGWIIREPAWFGFLVGSSNTSSQIFAFFLAERCSSLSRALVMTSSAEVVCR